MAQASFTWAAFATLSRSMALFIVGWIFLSIAAGRFAQSRSLSFPAFLLLSVVASPLSAFVLARKLDWMRREERG